MAVASAKRNFEVSERAKREEETRSGAMAAEQKLLAVPPLDGQCPSFYDSATLMHPKPTTLFFAPTRQFVEAQIVKLTADLADQRIHLDWWTDAELLDRFDPSPIDRHWNWNEIGIEYGDRALTTEKVAIVTGDQAVQGAMMISAEPVPSVLTPGAGALFVELLFTAPRNRPALRRDGNAFFLGVGTELLTVGGIVEPTKRVRGPVAT